MKRGWRAEMHNRMTLFSAGQGKMQRIYTGEGNEKQVEIIRNPRGQPGRWRRCGGQVTKNERTTFQNKTGHPETNPHCWLIYRFKICVLSKRKHLKRSTIAWSSLTPDLSWPLLNWSVQHQWFLCATKPTFAFFCHTSFYRFCLHSEHEAYQYFSQKNESRRINRQRPSACD